MARLPNPLLRAPAVGDNAAMQSEPPQADPPKRKRRWFQFSLRSLLIGVTVLAVICAVGVPLLREWLRPPEIVEPWLQFDVFSNEGALPQQSNQGRQIGGVPPSPVPVPVSAPPNYKPPQYAPSTQD